MKIVGIFFVSYIVLISGFEIDDDEYGKKTENRRFVPLYPYSEKLKKSQMNIPEDPSLTPMKAPRELVEEVAARSRQLEEPRTSILQDENEQKKLRRSKQYWDRLWFEPLEDGRRVDGEVPEAKNLPAKEPNTPETTSDLPAVPDMPQSIAERPKPVLPSIAQSYAPAFSMINYGKDHDDIEVKSEAHQISTQRSTSSTPFVFERKRDTTTTTTIRPIKNDKEDKSKKTDKLVIPLPGAEIQGSVRAKLVPGTKLYRLMKSAKKRYGESYQPKLLYVVNNYKNQNE